MGLLFPYDWCREVFVGSGGSCCGVLFGQKKGAVRNLTVPKEGRKR